MQQIIKAWPLLCPKPYFEFEMEYNEFQVYADCPKGEALKSILDEVSARLRSIPIEGPEPQYTLFICYDAERYKMFANKAGKPATSQGFNLMPLGYTFINQSFISKIKKANSHGYQYNLLEGNPAHIITHEITHQLLSKELGFFKVRQIPTWKLEGYCEYAASLHPKRRDSSYQFKNELFKYFAGQYDHIPAGRQFYIRSQLLTEYYLDHQENSFDTFMADSLLEHDLWQSLKRTFKSTLGN